MSNDKSERPALPETWQERLGRWVWWSFAAIALFFLLTEHRAHLFGVLPYVLLLACPLMHFFMHGKHGGSDPREPPRAEPPVVSPNQEEGHHEPR